MVFGGQGAGRVCVVVEAAGLEGLEGLEGGLEGLEGGLEGGLRWHGRAPRRPGGGTVLSVSVGAAEAAAGGGAEAVACGALEGALRALAGPGAPGLELEVLLTAPCPVPLCPDWTLERALRAPSLGAEAVTPLRTAGLVAVPRALSADRLKEVCELCDRRISAADKALEARGVAPGRDAFAFREVASRGGHRFDLLLLEEEDPFGLQGSSGGGQGGRAGGGGDGVPSDGSRAAEAEFLKRVAREAPWAELVTSMLGSGRGQGVRLWVSVVYSRPGAPPQEWHADGPHVGRCAGWDSDDGAGEAPPYALCVFVPLCDLSPEVGFTQFWPGTHRHDRLLGFGGACEVLGAQVDGLLRAGDALVYDYRLMHRGMPNQSGGGPNARQRAILQFFYHDSSYAERRNYGDAPLFAA